MKNRLTDLDINDPFYKANKDGLETRAIETCGEALEVVKAVQKQIAEDKVDEEGKPTAEYPCMCKGLANPYCPYHSDPNSPLQKELDKIFGEVDKVEENDYRRPEEVLDSILKNVGVIPSQDKVEEKLRIIDTSSITVKHLQDKMNESGVDLTTEVKKNGEVEPLQDEGCMETFKKLRTLDGQEAEAILKDGTKLSDWIRSYGESVRATQKEEIRKMVEGKKEDVSDCGAFCNCSSHARNDTVDLILSELDKLK